MITLLTPSITSSSTEFQVTTQTEVVVCGLMARMAMHSLQESRRVQSFNFFKETSAGKTGSIKMIESDFHPE